MIRAGCLTERLEPRLLLNAALATAARRIDVASAPIVQPLTTSGTGTLSTIAWTSIGPTQITNGSEPGNGPVSGRISGIAADPSDPNTIYVASAGGGVWKTTDGGGSWSPLTDNQPVLAMDAIAIAPSDPNTIYAATGQPQNSPYATYGQGILKSTDGGATWVLVGQSTFSRGTISSIVVDPTNSNNVYCSVLGEGTTYPTAAGGAYHSTDGGATWERVLNVDSAFGRTIASDLQMDPANPQHLLCGIEGTANGGGVYATTNGGTTWSVLTSLPNGPSTGMTKLAFARSNSQGCLRRLYQRDEQFP